MMWANWFKPRRSLALSSKKAVPSTAFVYLMFLKHSWCRTYWPMFSSTTSSAISVISTTAEGPREATAESRADLLDTLIALKLRLVTFFSPAPGPNNVWGCEQRTKAQTITENREPSSKCAKRCKRIKQIVCDFDGLFLEQKVTWIAERKHFPQRPMRLHWYKTSCETLGSKQSEKVLHKVFRYIVLYCSSWLKACDFVNT